MSGNPGWSRGYPVGRIYPPSWHAFQSPAHLSAICGLCGVRWDIDPLSPLSIAEIGCGTGYTASVLAAGNPQARVLGIDYNPAQIVEARRLAGEAGLRNVDFMEADLGDMGAGEVDALPEFDLITVHGVWSWVADPVREGILRIIRRRLRAGGIVLLSYNALPGAATALGLARLARGELRKAADPLDGIQAARSLVGRLMEAKAAQLLPSSWRRLLSGEAPGASDGYLIHEFQTEHWRPSFFQDVAEAMSSARCEFVGSATIDENFPQMSLEPAQRAVWEDAGSQAERQFIFDLCVQRAFRRDVYVRGLRPADRVSAVDAITMAATSRSDGELQVKAQGGVATLPPHQADAVRKCLFAGPQRIATLRSLPGCGSMTAEELLAVLIASGTAVPLWREPGTGPGWDDALAAARRLNAVAARTFVPHGVGKGQMALASPAIAGGLPGHALDLAVAARLAERPGEAPDASAVTESLLPPGPPPEASILSVLQGDVEDIIANKAPAWRALGIC
jgi:SAM-dependent methyltransferase